MKNILLIHGWNWKNYPQFNANNSWLNRSDFVNALKKNLEVSHPSMPGFGDSKIPSTAWGLDDYADWLDGILLSKKYDCILGYSFGAAVVTHWLYRKIGNPNSSANSVNTKIFLVSPAIIRKYRNQNKTTANAAKVIKKSCRLW